MVNAVPGLGDRLAAGELTPDEWVVRGETVCGPDRVLEPAEGWPWSSVS